MTYFSSSVPASGSLRIVRAGELKRITVAAGVHLEPLLGDALNINIVTLDPDAVADIHTHDEEQMGFIVRGSCTFTDGSDAWTVAPGDSYHAPPGCPHGATAGADGCVIIDVFSPPRAGLRELLEAD